MSRTVSRIALILTLALLFLLPSAALADLEGLEGSGTEDAPYLISSREDLETIAAAVNGGNDLHGVYFEQTVDINLGGKDDPWPVIGHVIGNTPHPFNGVYDGGNFKIFGLFVGTTDEDGDPVGTLNEDAGLFGHVGEKGVIRRVHVVDCNVYSKSLYVGGIAGRNEGLVEYCSSDATDPDASSGVVKGSWQYVGGIVGYNFGKISYCYSNCDVLGAQKAGGITGGQNGGTVVNCYFRGYVYADDITRAYAGGIAGENDGDSTIDNCYSDGTVEGKNNNEYCGAISGSNDTGSTVENCFWEDDGMGLPGIGSGMGDVENVEKRTQEEFDSGQVAWELSQGTDGDGWGQTLNDDNCDHDKHPHFTQAPDKDYDTTPVFRVTYTSTDPQIYEVYYVDPGENIQPQPSLPANAAWYVNGVEFDGTDIQSDLDAVAGIRILFAGENATIQVSATYHPLEQLLGVNLDQYMDYEEPNPSADGRFTYTIVNSEIPNAALSEDGRVLTIPQGTNANESGYTLTVTAHEKEPFIRPLALGPFGTDDVTLNINVVINKATPVIDPNPAASEITYGQTLVSSTLTGGVAHHPAANDVTVEGTFAWDSPATVPTVNEAAMAGYAVTFTPTGEDAKNYNPTTVMVPLTVEKVDPKIVEDPEPLDGTYNGKAQDLIKPGSAEGGTMKYSLDENGEYSSTIPARANADTYTVWYKVVGDENHNDTVPVSVEATIKPYGLEIPAQTLTYNGNNVFTLTLDGVTLDSDSAETVVATLTAGKKDKGEYTYADNATDTTYTVDLSSSNYAVKTAGELTIAPLPVVLTWSDPLVFPYDNQEHEVTASVDNAIGEDVIDLTYKDNKETEIGDYTATVTQLGNRNYTLDNAQNVSQLWYIIDNRESITLSVKDTEIIYGNELVLNATITPGDIPMTSDSQASFFVNGKLVGSAPVTYTDNQGHATINTFAISERSFSAGTNAVRVEHLIDNEPKGIAAATVTVIPKALTAEITGNTTKTYDGNTAAVGLSLKLNGVVECDDGQVKVSADAYTYDSKDVNDATSITAENVTLSGAQSGNYTLKTPVTVKGSIEPKVVRLEWRGINGLVYTGNPVNVTATATELIPDDECTVKVNNGDGIDAGDYTAQATGLTNSNYTLPGETTQDYTIAPASLYVPSQTVVYNGTKTLTATGVATGINGETVTIMYTASAPDVGDYAYSADSAAGDNVYTASTGNNRNYRIDGGGLLTITPAKPDVDWPSVSKPVYVNDPELTVNDWNRGRATGVDKEPIDGEFIVANSGAWSWDSAGTYRFPAIFTPSSANYLTVNGEVSITVDRRIVQAVEELRPITNKRYGTPQEDLGLPGTVTIITADGKRFENIPVTWSGYDPNTLDEQILTGELDLSGIDNEVKNPKNVTASITVILLPFRVGNVTYGNKTAPYSGSPIPHEVEGEIVGVSGITYVYKGKDGTVYGPSPDAPTDVGTYAVTATFSMDLGHPALGPVTVTLTIIPAQPSYTPPAAIEGLQYTGQPQELVTPGTADGGEMLYSLSEDGPYYASIPSGLEPGTYTVWYKVVGDKNHSDIAPQSIKVTILPSGVAPLDDVPKTGDGMNLGLWTALMILSASALCLIGRKRRHMSN